MNLDTYLLAAASTAVYPHVDTGSVPALAYVCMGLAGESTEVLEKELDHDLVGVAAELGDVAWYMARLYSELDLPVPDVTHAAFDPQPAARLVIAAGRCVELAKKAMRDDASVLTHTRRNLLGAHLREVTGLWHACVAFHGLDASLVLSGNAAKLASRRDRGVLAVRAAGPVRSGTPRARCPAASHRSRGRSRCRPR